MKTVFKLFCLGVCSFLFASFAWADVPADLAEGLQQYYSFNVSNEITAGANNVALVNGGGWIAGEAKTGFENALGSGGGFQVDNQDAFSPGTGNFTVAFWRKSNLSSGESVSEDSTLKSVLVHGVARQDKSYNQGWGIFKTSNGAIRLDVYKDKDNGVTLLSTAKGEAVDATIKTPFATTDSSWHHIAWTRGGIVLKLYVDGTLVAEGTVGDNDNAWDIKTTGSQWYRDLTVSYVDGHKLPAGEAMDDLAFWNRALSVEEIQSLQTAPLTSIDPLYSTYVSTSGIDTGWTYSLDDLANMAFSARMAGGWVIARGRETRGYHVTPIYAGEELSSVKVQLQMIDDSANDGTFTKCVAVEFTEENGKIKASAGDNAMALKDTVLGFDFLQEGVTYASNPSIATSWSGAGYGIYALTATPAVAHVSSNGSNYSSLAEAVVAATSGDTITLLADVTIDATVAESIAEKHLTVLVDGGTREITVAEDVSIKVEVATDAKITKLGLGELKVTAGIGTINLSEGTLGIIVTEESLSTGQTINNVTGATSENITVYMPNGTIEITGITVTEGVITIPAQTTQRIIITEANVAWDSAITAGIVEIDYTAITQNVTLTIPAGVSLSETKFKGPAIGNTLTVALGEGASLGLLHLESGKVALPIAAVNAHGADFTIPTDGALGIVINGDVTLDEAVVLSGEGALAVTGEGTLTIAHENTYAGGTTIASGATVKAASLTQLGGSGKAVVITGTLELTSSENTNEIASPVDYSHVTGTGTIKFSGSGWRTLPKKAQMFASTLALVNEQDDGLILTQEEGQTTTIGTLSGSKAFRFDWTVTGVADESRVLRIEQSDNSTYNGILLMDNGTNRLTKVQVACADGSSDKTLTLAGNTEVAKPLEIESTGSVKLTGTWAGDIIVDGSLEISTTEAKTIASAVTGSGTITITGDGGVTLEDVTGFTGTIVAAAKIGNTYYTTLSAATDAWQANNTIILIDATVEIPEGWHKEEGNILRRWVYWKSGDWNNGVEVYIDDTKTTTTTYVSGYRVIFTESVNVYANANFSSPVYITVADGITLSVGHNTNGSNANLPSGSVIDLGADSKVDYIYWNNGGGAAIIGDVTVNGASGSFGYDKTRSNSPVTAGNLTGTATLLIEDGETVTATSVANPVKLIGTGTLKTTTPVADAASQITFDTENYKLVTTTEEDKIVYAITTKWIVYIGEDKYASVAEAIASASDDATIDIRASVNEPLTIDKDVTLNVASGGTLQGTINIPEGKTLTVSVAEGGTLGTCTIMGAGTLISNIGLSTNFGGLTDAANWTGTFEFATLESNAKLSAYGNVGSKIRFKGTFTSDNAYFGAEGDTLGFECAAEFILDGSITLTNGFFNRVYTFAKLSGRGSFTLVDNGPNSEGNYVSDSFVFTDVTDFAGVLTASSHRSMQIGTEPFVTDTAFVFRGTLETLDLSAGAVLELVGVDTLTVETLILGTNRDFMGDLSKSKLVVTGSVQMTEGPTEGSPIEVTWTMDNTVPVTMTMLNGGTITTDPAQGGGFTVDGDGNLVFVTTLTGKGCWYEWTFDEATIENRLASSGRNATALGPATISDDANNYVTTEKGYALKLSAQALQDHLDYSESLEAPNWSSSFFARMPSNEGGVLVSFGSAPRTEKGALALVRGKSENQVVLVYIREGSSTCQVLADMKVPHAETDYHLYSFVKYGDDPEVETDNPRIEIFLDDRLWTTVQGDYAVSTGIKMGGLYYYQWSGAETLETYTADVNGGRITLVGAADITDDTTTEDVDETDTTPGAIDMLRIYDCYLELAEVSRIAEEYPYVSPYGDFTRTISTETANWNDADTWTKTLEGATSSVAYPKDGVATLTAEATTTVTVNMTEAAELEGLTLKGSELTLSAGTETKHITVTGSTQIDTNVNVDCQAISLEGPVEIASGKKLTLTLSDTLLTKWGAEYIVNGLAVTKSLTGYVTMGAAATVDVVAPSWTETTDEQGVITFTKDNFILTVKLDTTTNCWTATLDHKAWAVTIATDGTKTWKLGDATYKPTDPDTVFLEGATISVIASANAELTLNGTTKGMTITKGYDVTGDVTVTLQTPTDKTFNYLQLNDLIVGEGVTVVLAGDVRITKKPTMDATSIIRLGDGTEAPESSPLPAAYFPDNGTVAYNYTDGSTLTNLSGACNLHVMTGALTLNGDNDYTGTITIDTGVTLTSSSGTTPFGRGNTIVNNGTVTVSVNDTELPAMSGSGTLHVHNSMFIAGDLTISGLVDFNGGHALKRKDGTAYVVNGPSVTVPGPAHLRVPTTIVAGKTLTSAGTIVSPVVNNGEMVLQGGTVSGAISGSGSVTVESGTTTLSAANTYAGGTTVTAGTLKIAGVEDTTAVIKEGTTVTIERDGVLELNRGTSFITVKGAGTVKTTGTFTFGVGTGAGAISAPLNVASGGIFRIRAWKEFALTLPSVTVDGILKNDGYADSTVATLTMASGSTLSGSGSIELATSFEAGAILDATNAALTVAGAVTANEDLTIKVAEGVATGATVLAVGSCSTTHFANVVKADGTAAGLYATLDGTALTLVAKPAVPNAEGGALANTTQAVQDRIAYEALTEGKTTVTTVVVDSATGTKKHQVADAVEFFDNILEVTGEAEAATATVKYDFGITRMTILRNAQGASEVVLTVKVQNADATGLAPATFAEGTGLAVYIGSQKLEGVTIETTDSSTRTVRIPYEGNELFNKIGTYPITVRAVKEYEGSADTVAFVIDAHTSSMPVLASEVEEVTLLAFTQTGSIDTLHPDDRTSFSVTLEGDRVNTDPAAYTLTVDGVAATLVQEATSAMTTFGVSTTSSVTLNFTGFTLRKGSVVTLTTATENVGSSIAITENSWSDTFNGVQSFPFTTMVANTLVEDDFRIAPDWVGDGKVWRSYENSIGGANWANSDILMYRIPAMATNGAGEIVTLFDARYGSGDLGDTKLSGIDLGGNHSTDGGVTWQAKAYCAIDVANFRAPNGAWYNVANGTNDLPSADGVAITKEMDIGDPSMLYDPATGTYWAMAITGAGIAGHDISKNDCVLYTRETGVTTWQAWTGGPEGNTRSVKEMLLTSLREKNNDIAESPWAILAGPGHGIVTRQGWLVFPMQYFSSGTGRCFAAISKDNGVNWEATALTDADTNAQENCITELDDGSWYMMCKSGDGWNSPGVRRFYRADPTAESITWTEVDNCSSVNGNSFAHVQASFLRIGKGRDGRSRYVLAQDLGYAGSTSDDNYRAKLALIFGRDVSADNVSEVSKGIEWNWDNPIMIHEDRTDGEGYNSMCMVDSNTLGLLYEAKHHIYFERIDIRPYLNVVP